MLTPVSRGIYGLPSGWALLLGSATHVVTVVIASSQH